MISVETLRDWESSECVSDVSRMAVRDTRRLSCDGGVEIS